jgi:hypothetical protein
MTESSSGLYDEVGDNVNLRTEMNLDSVDEDLTVCGTDRTPPRVAEHARARGEQHPGHVAVDTQGG